MYIRYYCLRHIVHAWIPYSKIFWHVGIPQKLLQLSLLELGSTLAYLNATGAFITDLS